MIDLGRKQEPTTASPMEAQADPRIDYPSVHITSEKALNLPEHTFHAKVKFKHKESGWRKDEKGKKVWTHHLEMMAMKPMKAEKESAAEDAAEPGEEPEDAAMAIMKSMGRMHQKKMMDS